MAHSQVKKLCKGIKGGGNTRIGGGERKPVYTSSEVNQLPGIDTVTLTSLLSPLTNSINSLQLTNQSGNTEGKEFKWKFPKAWLKCKKKLGLVLIIHIRKRQGESQEESQCKSAIDRYPDNECLEQPTHSIMLLND